MSTEPTPRPSARMLGSMGALGFASGLPLYLTFFTLQQWLVENHVSLRAIGGAALVGLPYIVKFIWAPLLDHMAPGPLRRLGRRRGWMLPIQLCLTATIVLLSRYDPRVALPGIFATACLLAFLSASQDIVIDAWRIESFPGPLQAAALGAYSWGYRIAMLCSGAGAIWLAARIGWPHSLLAMAALSLVGPCMALLIREPAVPGAEQSGDGWRAALRHRVIDPFRDLLGRPDSVLVILFVLVANLGTQLADTMAYPFYHALGFAPTTVAAANGVPALVAALAGAAASGFLVARLGLGRSLILTACVQMGSILLYVALARSGPVPALLLAKVTLEGFAEVMAATTFSTYLSRLCSLNYTATQFALLSSLAPVAWRTLGGTTGILAQSFGWTGFFLFGVAACLPGIAIMLTLLRRHPGGLPQRAAPV